MSLTASEVSLAAQCLNEELAGCRVGRIYELGQHQIALDMGRRGYLVLSARPRLGYVLLASGIRKPGQCPAFCGLLRKHLSGRFLDRVSQVGRDRILDLAIGRHHLVAELFGGGIYLLDAERRILGHSGRKAHGGVYEPPPQPPRPSPPPRFEPGSGFWESVNAYVAEQERLERERELRQGLLRHLRREIRRLERLTARLRADMERHGDSEEWQHKADILLASAHLVPRGADRVEVPDWYRGGEPVTLSLDPALGPAENAERFYRRARRARRAAAEAAQRLEEARGRIAELQGLLAEVEASGSLESLEALGRRLGFCREPSEARSGRPRSHERRQPYRVFRSASGLEIWVGRSARDNHELTFHHARGRDLWFHVTGRPGPHVILRLPKDRQADPEAILDAATLAVFFSTRDRSAEEEVAWTERKYVRPVKGQPGKVTYSAARHLLVQVDPTRIERILTTSPGD